MLSELSDTIQARCGVAASGVLSRSREGIDNWLFSEVMDLMGNGLEIKPYYALIFLPTFLKMRWMMC